MMNSDTKQKVISMGEFVRNKKKLHRLSIRVFGGDEAKALAWLNKPSRTFSGQSPMELMKTQEGAKLVEERLLQIDAGFFA